MKPTFLSTAAVAADLLQVFGQTVPPNACLGGSCVFNVEESSTSMGATISISGPPSAISDITASAGWQILNCTAGLNNQTISLVCSDKSLGCNHLFIDGAEDTVVRLPADCGGGFFARVVNHWIIESGSSGTTSHPRDSVGASPEVHILELDDDFGKASGRHGNVSFQVAASTSTQTSGMKQKRQSTGGSTTGETVTVNASNNTVPFDTSLICPAVNGIFAGGFQANLASQVAFTILIEVSARGTIIPPEITALEVSAPATATIGGTSELFTSLQGVIENFTFDLVDVALPGFIASGLLSIEPTFTVVATYAVVADNQTNYDGFIGLNFSISNVQFQFPTNGAPATADVSAPSVPITVITSPNEFASVGYASNVDSAINLGIAAFGSATVVTISYNADFNARMLASPGSTPNSVSACTTMLRIFEIVASNSGPFFSIFGPAGSDVLVVEEFPALQFCGEAPLGSESLTSISSRGLPVKRNDPILVSCATPEPTAITAVVFEGMSE